MQERLQKLLSQAGIASRREAETYITQKRVTINGKVAGLGDKADPAVDEIRFDGERLHIAPERVYIMVNKPMGVVTTVRAQEQERRQTIRDIVPVEGYIYPAGRLDADSEGLVLLTNDGALAQKLTHPRYHHPKIYEVTLHGNVPNETLDIWRRGVMLDDGPTQPVEIKLIDREAKYTVIQVTMLEGRKRQIRRIASTLGYSVSKLVRTHLGVISLGKLRPGEWRHLDEDEISALRASARGGKLAPSSIHNRHVPVRAMRKPDRPEHVPEVEKARHSADQRPRDGQRSSRANPPKPPARSSRRPAVDNERPGGDRPVHKPHPVNRSTTTRNTSTRNISKRNTTARDIPTRNTTKRNIIPRTSRKPGARRRNDDN